MAGEDAEMALVSAGLEDLGDLLDREAQLVVGRVEVRPQADAGVGAEVAKDLPLGQLPVDSGEVGHVHRHRAAATVGRPRAPHLEPAAEQEQR